MKKIIAQLFYAIVALILLILLSVGASTIVNDITDNESLISLSRIALGLLLLIIGFKIYTFIDKDIKLMNEYMTNEAYTRNVLHDWSRNKITTKQALQYIDTIYDHHYTDNIIIKDGDKS